MRWRVLIRLPAVLLVMGVSIAGTVYYTSQQASTPCKEVGPKILTMSHDRSLEADAVRVLSVETVEEEVVEQRGFRCVGIAVTTEGLAWVIYSQITHSDETTYYGYDLSDTEPENAQ